MSIQSFCHCKCGCGKETCQLVNNRCKDCDRSNHYNLKTGLRTQIGVASRRRLTQ